MYIHTTYVHAYAYVYIDACRHRYTYRYYILGSFERNPKDQSKSWPKAGLGPSGPDVAQQSRGGQEPGPRRLGRWDVAFGRRRVALRGVFGVSLRVTVEELKLRFHS